MVGPNHRLMIYRIGYLRSHRGPCGSSKTFVFVVVIVVLIVARMYLTFLGRYVISMFLLLRLLHSNFGMRPWRRANPVCLQLYQLINAVLNLMNQILTVKVVV